MSYTTLLELRNALVSSSELTSLVDDEDIQVGWKRELTDFPCIIISQAGGVDYGYLGYSTSPSGSKLSREESYYQIDIYSRTSMKNILDIYGILREILIKLGYRKTADNDAFEIEYNAFRKITTWRKVTFHND